MTNTDAISRQAVIDLIESGISTDTDDDIEYVKGLINKLPSVNPQEPKTGHWIPVDSTGFEFHRVYKCSECGTTEIEYPECLYEHFRYCPNCGCRMVESQESEE